MNKGILILCLLVYVRCELMNIGSMKELNKVKKDNPTVIVLFYMKNDKRSME